MVAEPGARPAGTYQFAGRGSAAVALTGSRWETEQIPVISHWERFTDYTNWTDELHFHAGFKNLDESWMLYSSSLAIFEQLPDLTSLSFLHLYMFDIVLSVDLSCFHCGFGKYVLVHQQHQGCKNDLETRNKPNPIVSVFKRKITHFLYL